MIEVLARRKMMALENCQKTRTPAKTWTRLNSFHWCFFRADTSLTTVNLSFDGFYRHTIRVGSSIIICRVDSYSLK